MIGRGSDEGSGSVAHRAAPVSTGIGRSGGGQEMASRGPHRGQGRQGESHGIDSAQAAHEAREIRLQEASLECEKGVAVETE